jgi:acyl-CoA synthetase (AMP-forming)/AMP-acid ligase II
MSPRKPYVLSEREITACIDRLDEAWRESRTFALLGDQFANAQDWVVRMAAALPDDYDDNHFILLTSGSTGRPKLVVGRRDRAERLAEVLHELQQSGPVQETIITLPLTYCFAFVNQWLWARRHHRRLVVTPGLARPDELKQALCHARDAMICFVGGQVTMLEQYYRGSEFPGIIRIHFAGSRFPQERLDFLRSLFPNAEIFNNYGCAEAMPRLTLRRAEAASHSNHIGWPLPGIEMKSDDTGRILFRSPYGAVALLDDGGLTCVEPSTWVPSGDLGRAMGDGHWELMGREGELFKRYGEKVSVSQILCSVNAAWRGQTDCYRELDARGEIGYVLVVAPRPTDDEVRAILKSISADHPRAHWPLRVESLEYIPLLSNGKIDRESLSQSSSRKEHWKQRL